MTGLEHFTLSEPQLTRSIAGHTPVSSGTQADAANLGAVGQAGALELLREEATHEGRQPFFDGRVIVHAGEGFPCGAVDLARRIAEAQHVVQEKVVQLVKAEHEKARKILAENREKLDELAMYLYEKETITGDEFMSILDRK